MTIGSLKLFGGITNAPDEAATEIAQAKEVLAEREGLPMEATFDLLWNYARSHHLKLSDLAHQVVYPPHLADAVLATRRPARNSD